MRPAKISKLQKLYNDWHAAVYAFDQELVRQFGVDANLHRHDFTLYDVDTMRASNEVSAALKAYHAAMMNTKQPEDDDDLRV